MVREIKNKTPIPNSQQSEVSDVDRNALDIIKAKVKSFNPFRKRNVPEWTINMSYLTGNQHIGILGGHLQRMPNLPAHTVTANKLGPAVQNDIALGTKNRTKFDIMPAGTDTDDKATAIAGQQVLDYLRRKTDFDKQREQLITWYDIANVSWRKITWNPKSEITGINPPQLDGNGNPDENHNPELPVGLVWQGDVQSEVVPTNELIWDWRVPLDKQKWIIHARPMTLGEIINTYGVEKASLIPASSLFIRDSNKNEFEINIFNEFMSEFSGSTSATTVIPEESEINDKDKLIDVYEFWHVRDDTVPEGMFAVMAGLDDGVMLVNNPYPIETYPHGELPLIPYAPLNAHKNVIGTSSRLTQARPLQREYNTLRTQILENTESLGNGLWMTPRESKIDFKRMDSGVGLYVEYEGRFPPHREPGISVSGGLFAHLELIKDDINEVFAFHSASKGKQPKGGPRSGVGIALLQEKDVTQNAPIIREFEKKDEIAVYQMLSVAFANYGDRLLPIIGDDNSWTMFRINTKDMTGKINVVAQSGSSLPFSKAVQIDTTFQLLQMGLINVQDPESKRKVLSVMDVGGLEDILKDEAKDINFAKKEFLIAEQAYIQGGGPEKIQQIVGSLGGKKALDAATEAVKEIVFVPQVQLFDRHDIHVIEHRKHLVDNHFKYQEAGDIGLFALDILMQEHFARHGEILQEQQVRQAILAGEIKQSDLEASEDVETKES